MFVPKVGAFCASENSANAWLVADQSVGTDWLIDWVAGVCIAQLLCLPSSQVFQSLQAFLATSQLPGKVPCCPLMVILFGV